MAPIDGIDRKVIARGTAYRALLEARRSGIGVNVQVSDEVFVVLVGPNAY
jgi:hypothetical protein